MSQKPFRSVSKTFPSPIGTQKIDTISLNVPKYTDVVQFEIIHEQLPLPVPCYDLLPVIELALGPHEVRFRALPTPLSWRAVSTRLENVFTTV